MELSVDGKTVYAATGGKPFDPAQPTVVFIHGVAMDHTIWALQTRWFAYHGRNVLAIDLPGCGRSAGPLPDSIAALASWLVRFLDALGVAEAALVGHSLGALVAMQTAADAPQRVRALAMLGAALPMKVNPEMLQLAHDRHHRAIEFMNDWAHGRRAHMGGNTMPGMWLVGTDVRLVEQAPDGALPGGFELCSGYSAEQGYAAAAKVRCKVLLLLGDNDLMTPLRSARMLATKFADVDTVVLPHCGHMLTGERPDETLDALRQAM